MPERVQDSHDLTALVRAADSWHRRDPDPETRAEVESLLDPPDEVALRDRFGSRIQFGTAGLRGLLGAGPARMNRLLVRRAAAGLARYLGPGTSVTIGFDARHRSREFAEDSARVLAAAGVRALVAPRPGPTPQLAFAVRHRGVDAGVMVTASHNPAGYNGYKVYLGDGAQIVPPADAEISRAIDEVPDDEDVPLSAMDDRLIEWADDVEDDYVAFAAGVVGEGRRDVRVAYTPLHGVGGRVAVRAFERAGFSRLDVVAQQWEPDPDFPTVPFPNPEEPGAMDLLLARAREVDADVALANDPDADRLGVAVPDDGEWRVLDGNEIGSLLADHVLGRTTGPDRLVVTTIVSSPQLEAMARAADVHVARTLTGFKWVVRPGIDDPSLRFVFGFEEALGYSVAEYVRDKDGITAALAFADLVADLLGSGRTVTDRLAELAEAHGFHGSLQWSVRLDGPDGHERIAAVMRRLREDPPSSLGGHDLTEVEDYLLGVALPPTDAVRLQAGDTRVVVRPSGTEPKVKVYVDAAFPVAAGRAGYREARTSSQVALARVRDDLVDQLRLGS